MDKNKEHLFLFFSKKNHSLYFSQHNINMLSFYWGFFLREEIIEKYSVFF